MLRNDVDTINMIEELANIQCTQAEAAAVLRVSNATFSNFLNKYPEAKEAWVNGRQRGKTDLRRLQYKQSQKSVPMSIHLGKQYLGQSEKLDSTNTLEAGDSLTSLLGALSINVVPTSEDD